MKIIPDRTIDIQRQVDVLRKLYKRDARGGRGLASTAGAQTMDRDTIGRGNTIYMTRYSWVGGALVQTVVGSYGTSTYGAQTYSGGS